MQQAEFLSRSMNFRLLQLAEIAVAIKKQKSWVFVQQDGVNQILAEKKHVVQLAH